MKECRPCVFICPMTRSVSLISDLFMYETILYKVQLVPFCLVLEGSSYLQVKRERLS